MKLSAIFAGIFLLFTAISLALPDYAEAARMGGGRSFGSRPSMSRPAPAPRQSTTQRQATTAPTQTPGRMGMMGGLFGGLLAGTLLGSLLGNGMGGGGGLLDIIILGLLFFVGYKLYKKFRSRTSQETAPAGASRYYNANSQNEPPLQVPLERTDGGADAWSRLKAAVTARDAGQTTNGFNTGDSNDTVPAGFDTEEFLQGAKAVYNRLQSSWDKRDLSDISQFATAAVMANLQNQLEEDPEPSHTEIMLVNAQLLGVEKDGPGERAQVYFDVLMRESPTQKTPENVREIWHFLRMGQNGNWKLDGIQQVE